MQWKSGQEEVVLFKQNNASIPFNLYLLTTRLLPNDAVDWFVQRTSASGIRLAPDLFHPAYSQSAQDDIGHDDIRSKTMDTPYIDGFCMGI